jgi:hypothetical protein
MSGVVYLKMCERIGIVPVPGQVNEGIVAF